jgi:hypothetical protein
MLKYIRSIVAKTVRYPMHTVRLTSIYYRVPGNQNFRFTPTETMDGQVKKIRSPTCDMV